ncbi:MAG: hypothetical protein AMS14_00400 [Planctomycetes bacterium DG_20]|nr:MAG: hypothetical protein AMS14_00400 [Planctomycetes bacterium DG_20]
MAIEFTCDCGAACSADDSQAGQLFHCEACGLDIPVPSPADAPETAAPAQVDVTRAAVEDMMEDAEAHAEAERAMIEQIKEVRGDPGEITARRRQDLDALKRETAGEVDEEAVKAKRNADIQALHAQIGSQGGIAEIAEQMRPLRGEAVAVSAAELGPRTARPIRKGPPKGQERAAHHIGIKRAIWLPSLLVGLACVGVGVYCFLPSAEPNPYGQHVAYFQEQLKKAGIGEFEVVEAGKGSWAIPKGATHSVSQSGIVYFQNVPAYGQVAPDEPAVDATDYVKSQTHQSGRQSKSLQFAVLLTVVGLVLVVLSIVTLRDVRIVAAMRAEAAETPEEAEAAQAEGETPDEVEAAEGEDEASDEGSPHEWPDEPSDDAEPRDEEAS